MSRLFSRAAVLMLFWLALTGCGRPDRARQADRPRGVSAAPVSLTIAAVGDIYPADQAGVLEAASGLLRRADVTFANVECQLTLRGEPTALKLRGGETIDNEFFFRTDPGFAYDLAGAGIDVVSLANNHGMDYGQEGLTDTLDALAAARLVVAGAAWREPALWPPALVERHGLRTAWLAYVVDTTLPGTAHFAASGSRGGVAFLTTDGGQPDPDSLARLRREIAAARRRAEVVMVSVHWGIERATEPSPLQQALGRAAIEAGADAVIGHHPHVLQGVGWHHGRPILYSLGNFAFPARVDRQQESAVAWLTWREGSFEQVVLRPVRLGAVAPEPVGGAAAEGISRALIKRSRALGSHAAPTIWDGAPAAVSRPGATSGARDELIEVTEAVPGVRVELAYASDANVFGQRLYDANRAFLRRGTARRLAQAQAFVAARGLSLLIWDAYRPRGVQQRMWEQVRDARYVANPARGSNHNRGAAVDLTLADAAGRPLPMPTAYDDFTAAAHAAAPAADPARRNRALLRRAMTAAGFQPLETEWWHFDDPEAASYPLEAVTLADLAARSASAADPGREP